MKNKTFICLLIFLSTLCTAQKTVVRGVVVDAGNKEFLPFVNLVFSRTKVGTVTDINGEFKIETTLPVDSLTVSCLGFITKKVKVTAGVVQEIEIRLQSSSKDLTEVTVKAQKKVKYVKDTTAYMIYQEVVNHRSANDPKNLTSYTCSSYTKNELDVINLGYKWQKSFIFKPFRYAFEQEDTLENGTKYFPGLIREKLSTLSYTKNPVQNKELVNASKISGVNNSTLSSVADWQFQDVNIYDPIIQIANKSIISPFSPIARATYRYFLNDTLEIDGRVSYLLKFAPISKEDLAFTGSAWIDSATYGVQSISMFPNEKANINFITEYKIQQNYSYVNNEHWFMSNEKVQAILTPYDRKRAISMYFKKSNSREQIRCNIPIADSIFKGDPIQYELDYTKKDDEYWVRNRHDTLTRKEKMIYSIVDSLKRTKAYKRYEWSTYFITSGYINTGKIEFGQFYKFISRNSVEGWRPKFGFRTNNTFSRTVQFSGYGAYGLQDKDWKYGMSFILTPKTKNNKWSLYEFNYRYDVTILGQEDVFLAPDNFFYILRKTPLSRVMKLRQYTFNSENELTQGLNLMTELKRSTYFQIPGVFDFKHFNSDGSFFTEAKFSDFRMGVGIRYSFKETYMSGMRVRKFIHSKYPVITFNYSIGMLHLLEKNELSHKFDFMLKQRLPSPIGYTKYTLSLGCNIGPTPYPLMYFTAGNFGYIYNSKTYNLSRDYEFAYDKYVSFWFEHHFDGFFFNKIPYFSKLQLREFITFKGLIGGLSKRNASLYEIPSDIHTPNKKPYIEVGFGIENILKVVRVDFLWRATYRNEPDGLNFAIKFSFQPSF